MTITLTTQLPGAVPIELPEDLVWTDELTWSRVAQTSERGIFGTLIIDAMERDGGRPITLTGGGSDSWIARATLLQVKALSDVPGLRMTLDIRGEVFTVVFDHGSEEQTKALAMSAVIDYCDPEDGDYYCSLTLRFLEASETP